MNDINDSVGDTNLLLSAINRCSQCHRIHSQCTMKCMHICLVPHSVRYGIASFDRTPPELTNELSTKGSFVNAVCACTIFVCIFALFLFLHLFSITFRFHAALLWLTATGLTGFYFLFVFVFHSVWLWFCFHCNSQHIFHCVCLYLCTCFNITLFRFFLLMLLLLLLNVFISNCSSNSIQFNAAIRNCSFLIIAQNYFCYIFCIVCLSVRSFVCLIEFRNSIYWNYWIKSAYTIFAYRCIYLCIAGNQIWRRHPNRTRPKKKVNQLLKVSIEKKICRFFVVVEIIKLLASRFFHQINI